MERTRRIQNAFIATKVLGRPGTGALIGGGYMPSIRDFDEIAIVVDWIDACKRRDLEGLLDLYDNNAVVECCEGGSFEGRSEMARYWRPRLARAGTDAFEIDALFPEQGGVSLDYRGYDGKPVRTIFRFNAAGKIQTSACDAIRAAA